MEQEERSKRVIWLAEWAMLAHAVLALLGVGWAWLVGEPGLALVVVLLFGCALVVFVEWKNGWL